MSSEREVHQTLERLSCLFRGSFRRKATEHGLKLVQLEALVYFAQANRYSDTAAALTEYLGATKGTVSQTIKILEKRGFVVKTIDPDDRRVSHCGVTAAGLEVVDSSVPVPLVETLDSNIKEQTLSSAKALLGSLLAGHDFRTFGQCHSCQHHVVGSDGRMCGLTGDRLSESDAGRLCREHKYPLE